MEAPLVEMMAHVKDSQRAVEMELQKVPWKAPH